MSSLASDRLAEAEVAVREALGLLDRAFRSLATVDHGEDHEVVLYDLVHAYAAGQIAEHYVSLSDEPEDARLAFALEAVKAAANALFGRVSLTGVAASDTEGLSSFVDLAESALDLANPVDARPRPISPELDLVRQSFARLAEEVVAPVAERVHRFDRDIPESVIKTLADAGTFAMTVGSDFGGMATGSAEDLIAMLIATEELSRASLAVGGSLATRPEILIRVVEEGGTDQQKQVILPRVASGESLVAVAVTEPDHGSDVGNLRTTAVRDGDDWVLNGVKTWCTFAGRADVLLVLARTGPDQGHRGLSLFLVEKPSSEGHEFRFTQDGGGSISGHAIPTIGYRGMHSFEVAFNHWRVPHESLVGGDAGIGRGFYLQMGGFAAGRLQTAARAVGVMHSAVDLAKGHAEGRIVFGRSLHEFPLTRAKLLRMAATVRACREYTYHLALGHATGDPFRSALVKLFACRAAEWVTREAMQVHGGYGYAEEYAVSRLFVDARVLSIFEGADEVLALRVIARNLLGRAAAPSKRGR